MNLKVTTQSIEILGRQIVFDLPADQEEMLALALNGEASGVPNGIRIGDCFGRRLR